MRIGIVCPYSFDEAGGVQAHVLDLAEVLIAQGHEVKVLGPGTNKAAVPDYVVCAGPSIAIPYNGSVARLSIGLRAWRAVRRFIRDGCFDVLHIHEPNAPSLSMLALILAKGPIVATYHASSSGSLILRCVLPILRPWLEKINGGIAVSELARRWQVEQLGGDPVLIPNGVDVQRFAPTPPTTSFVRGDATPPSPGQSEPADPAPDPALPVMPAPRTDVPAEPTPLACAFLGRLDEPRKGFDILLDALAQLDRPYSCVAIGSGTPRVPTPGMPVTFAGRVSEDDKARILADADVYIAPNTGGESFGIVLVEAMAAGAAVVASDLEAFAAVTDAYGERPAGVLFPVGNARELARVLRELSDDPERRRRLAEYGHERAWLYDWSRVSKSIMDVYKAVADGSVVRV